MLIFVFHFSLDLTVSIVLGDRLALVVEFFASAKTDLDLDF